MDPAAGSAFHGLAFLKLYDIGTLSGGRTVLSRVSIIYSSGSVFSKVYIVEKMKRHCSALVSENPVSAATLFSPTNKKPYKILSSN